MSLLSRLAVQAARAYGILSSRSTNISADYLVVAGGGGGGSDAGGGGGAGGMLTSTATLSTLNTYSITVGAGGAGATYPATRAGNNGSNSVISGTGLSTVTSTGGGGGGSRSSYTAGNGGSGGGQYVGGGAGGTGISGQGNNGSTTSPNPAGGGGGAGAAGSVGNGGNGLASSISGSSVTYAGGGGGGASTTGGTGGTGGGGNGVSGGTLGNNGTTNLGGGAGGSYTNTAGSGGSGIVIISYTSATPKFVGGTITTSGGKQIHTFTSSGTLSPITPITASYLVVAGGGGGGVNSACGGGAGGLLTSSTTLYSGATYIVTVGAGGAGGVSPTAGSTAGGANGSNSSVAGTGLTTITSIGGGLGAAYTGQAGGNGGSGGGGNPGGTATAGQGYDGGTGAYSAGGGAGGLPVTVSTGNNGGPGLASSISGTSTYYAGGGGGAGDYRWTPPSSGLGGIGGGGDGSYIRGGNAGSGTPNSGGGGGASSFSASGGPSQGNGGAGGSGIVIISYAGSQVFNGGLVTSSGGNTIHTFTSTGALTPLTNNLNNSLRFRSSASAYLSRTPTVAGNTKTWTWSGWVKRGSLGSLQSIMTAPSGGSEDSFAFLAGDTIRIFFTVYSSSGLITNAVFRDPSAWYHIVLAIDTTQATAANRVKLYVNGNQQTFTGSDYPAQNATPYFNSALIQYIARYANQTMPTGNFDGYMTDINFIDGQALEPYYFGNNDANGVWKPIQYKGTYGTNGFYLTFGNTTSTTTLGYDSSPNGNNWTCNNISLTAGSTYDAMLDVPTNTSATVANFPVLSPLSNGGATISNANLTVTANGATHYVTNSTFQIPTSGKWYWETTASTLGSTARLSTGILPNGTALSGFPYTSSNTYGWYYGDASNNLYWKNNGSDLFNITGAVNDVLQICYDADNGTVYAGKNNVFYNSSGGTTGSPSTLTNPTSTGASSTNAYFPATTVFTAGVLNINFGQRPFSYTPPTGFVALNTYNLPTPTILQGNKYMDATLYTGNGSTQTIVNNAQFKPDFVWVKGRSVAYVHGLFDSVRGVGKNLNSASTNAENTNDVDGYLSAFNGNGYTLIAGTTSSNTWNQNAATYVGWQWQAGQGTTSSNTSGSITSTVSVNTTAGFSIATFTGASTQGATFGHGLGVAPKMVIAKSKTGATQNWWVYHASLGYTNNIYLNSTAASFADGNTWLATPSSTLVTIGDNFVTSATYVAYCWAEIAGFSKFGSYTGNGSADGVFVYTGFIPAFILIKVSSTADEWVIFDNKRPNYNATNLRLNPNSSGTEQSTQSIDILSNGFKARSTGANINGSGNTYIYAAFASNPFKNSNSF